MTAVGEQTASGRGRTGRVASLRFRLAVAVAAIVVVGMAGSLTVGYVVDYRARKRTVLASLMEQAHSLELARGRIGPAGEYAAYVDEFCARMNAEISPGHHILIIGPRGQAAASSRRHSGPEVERALLTADPGRSVLSAEGRRLAQVRLRTADGSTVVVAQYLDHMESMLRRSLLTRGVSTSLIGGLIVVLLMAAIRAWVLKPITKLKSAGREWSRRHFAVRAGLSGPRDLRSLVAAFNRMAGELEAHESRRLAEMAKAREIQQGLLPSRVPKVPGLAEVIARYRPAEDVAGDLYDIIPLPDGRTAIAVLDVCGHGVSAALLTGVAKMALHWRLAEPDGLPAVLEKVNGDLVRCLADGQFVTLCVGLWNAEDSTWTYCAAGHPGGALQTADAVEHLPSTGPLLGAVEEAEWFDRVVKLKPGQRLWLYTDGLIEAGAPSRKLDTEGLEHVLRQTASVSLEKQASGLMREAVSRQRAEAEDDITIVGFECLSTGGPDETEEPRP
jgi:sigma-B regulation protein RsbU (phosphoserine phosphatase)